MRQRNKLRPATDEIKNGKEHISDCSNDVWFSVFRLGSYKSRNSEKWISISEFASRVDVSKVVSLSHFHLSTIWTEVCVCVGGGSLPVAGGGVNMCFEAVPLALRPIQPVSGGI